ncbi:tetratricopeptide repeat protein [Nitrospinota bacterium]
MKGNRKKRKKKGRPSQSPVSTPAKGVDAAIQEAVSFHQSGDFSEAERRYRHILEKTPDSPDANHLLGVLCDQVGRSSEAIPLIQKAIFLQGAEPLYFSHLGMALVSLSRFDEAVEVLSESLRMDPTSAKCHNNMGNALNGLGRFQEAIESFQAAIRLNPHFAEAHNNLGLALAGAKRADEAIAHYEKALEIHPGLAEAHNNMGNALNGLGRFQEAIESFQAAIRLNPHFAEAHNNLGLALAGAERADEAIAHYEKALEIHPGLAEAHNNMGNALNGLGRFQEAIESFQAAIRLNPHFAQAHNNLGLALAGAKRTDEAVAHYEKALEIHPGLAEAHNNMGNAMREKNQYGRAAESFKKAVELMPDNPIAYLNLGLTYKDTGRTAEAEETYRAAQRIAPSDGTRIRLATLLPVIHPSREKLEVCRRTFEGNIESLLSSGIKVGDPISEVGSSTFYLAYQGFNDKEVQEKIGRLYHQVGAFPKLNRNLGSKMRVGFISKCFREHTIGKFMKGFVEKLSRESFEVVVLSTAHPGDPVFQEFQRCADEFVILPDNLPSARDIVHKSRLDVLFYSDIGMDPLTYFMAFSRLAPVQCVTWGHPVTTGMRTIDYFISSEDLEPEGAEGHYSEKLVRFSSLPTYYYQPRISGPPRSRSFFGFAEDEHVYLCPQSLFKFHPDFDDPLGEILRADPRGRVILIGGLFTEWNDFLRARLSKAVPDVVDRINFVPRQNGNDYLCLVDAADVVLDPFHFGGGNTTYECLALGRPIVTLPGQFMRGRVTYACYRKMGMDECVATTPGEYVDIAVRLGADPSWREKVKNKILASNHVLYEDIEAVRELERFFADAAGKNAQKSGRPK